jgi:hypothetical protein
MRLDDPFDFYGSDWEIESDGIDWDDSEYELISSEINDNIEDINDMSDYLDLDLDLYEYQLFHAEQKSNIIVAGAVMFWFLAIRLFSNNIEMLENNKIIEEYNNISLMGIC